MTVIKGDELVHILQLHDTQHFYHLFYLDNSSRFSIVSFKLVKYFSPVRNVFRAFPCIYTKTLDHKIAQSSSESHIYSMKLFKKLGFSVAKVCLLFHFTQKECCNHEFDFLIYSEHLISVQGYSITQKLTFFKLSETLMFPQCRSSVMKE